MTLDDLTTIAVAGMGTMGRGIAHCLAAAGYTVRCYEVDAATRDQATPLLQSLQHTLIKAGLLASDQAAPALARIHLSADLAQCVADAQLVVEAIPENLELKLGFYASLEELCEPDTIFASNTSGLSITALAAATRRADRVVGFHWWNPAHLMPLIEVTKGEGTSDHTTDLLMALSRKLGKRPILVQRDIPGFVGNRLQFAVLREALHLVQEGIASPEDVDTAMKAGPGIRYAFLGPLETADLGGLDVFASIASYLFGHLATNAEPPECLTALVADGKAGVKAGEGFYSYTDSSLADILAKRDQTLITLARILGYTEDTEA